MAQLKDLIVTGTSRFLGNIYGTLNGNADTATKATQDSAGQQINATYIKGLSVSGKTITYTKGNGTTGTITTQDTNTTYSNATTSAAGLMSSSDKSKLDGIAAGANKTTVDSALSSTSENPVQNKVVNAAISNLNSLVGDTAVATQIANAVSVATSNTLSMMIPVGYIFQWVPTDGGPDLSTADKVKAYYGFGTWEEVSGRFLIGRSGSYGVGTTGGNETHTHTNPSTGSWNGTSGSTAITVEQMPSHSHSMSHTHTFSGTSGSNLGTIGLSNYDTYDIYNWWANGTGASTLADRNTDRYRYRASRGNNTTGAWDGDDNAHKVGYQWNLSHAHTYSGTTSGSSAANSGANGSGSGHSHSIPSHTHTVGNTGASSNMPPYLAVYMWKRTA